MKTQLESALREAVHAILSEQQQQADIPVRLTRPKSQEHGDYAVNVAMPLAGILGAKPHAVAEMILAKVSWPAAVETAEIAGPGFINLTLKPQVWGEALRSALAAGRALEEAAVHAAPTAV